MVLIVKDAMIASRVEQRQLFYVLLHLRLGSDRWRCFARPAKRLRIGQIVNFADDFAAEVKARNDDGTVDLGFSLGDAAFFAALERYGALPLPPYITHADTAQDADRYQTVFARNPGAVAAPCPPAAATMTSLPPPLPPPPPPAPAAADRPRGLPLRRPPPRPSIFCRCCSEVRRYKSVRLPTAGMIDPLCGKRRPPNPTASKRRLLRIQLTKSSSRPHFGAWPTS